MNQLGKHLVFAICAVAMLLVILCLQREFGAGQASLLSQPSEGFETTTAAAPKNSPQPRVLQAQPATQHDDRTILSPTGSPYANSEGAAAQGNGDPIAPIPSVNTNPAVASPRPLEAPDLVPVGVAATSPVTNGVDDEGPPATPAIDTPTPPAAARPVPESVVTRDEDSFWSISEQVYGSGAYYRALFRHNEAKVLRPDQLREGIEVRTPPLEVLRQLYPGDFPGDPSLTTSP